MPLQIGLLDFCTLSVQHTLDHAELAESLGYSRYWLGEHFQDSHHANALMLSGFVAGVTRRIRVGPAGVLLRLHAPLHVANGAALLAKLFPRRIDLGLAGGTAPAEVLAMLGPNAEAGREAYERRLREVASLLRGETTVKLQPVPRHLPQFWQLTSSGKGAQFAAELGACLSVSLFSTPELPSPDVVGVYREAMARAHPDVEAIVNVGVSVACAETEQEARTYSSHPLARGVQWRVIGTPEQCADQLQMLATRYGVDELVVLTMCPDTNRQAGSIEMLAKALHLPSEQTTSASEDHPGDSD